MTWIFFYEKKTDLILISIQNPLDNRESKGLVILFNSQKKFQRHYSSSAEHIFYSKFAFSHDMVLLELQRVWVLYSEF